MGATRKQEGQSARIGPLGASLDSCVASHSRGPRRRVRSGRPTPYCAAPVTRRVDVAELDGFGLSRLRLMSPVAFARRRPLLEDLLDEPEILRFAGAEEFVAFDGGFDLIDRPAGIFRHELIHPVADPQYLPGLDLDVGVPAVGAAGGWWTMILALVRATRIPGSPAQCGKAPTDAA